MPWLPTAFAIGVALIFLRVNIQGSSTAGHAETVVTGLKVVLLLVVIAFGLNKVWGSPEAVAAFKPFLPNGWGGMIGAMGITFIAFEGYEIIVQTAEEVRNPTKIIPRAIMISILIAVAIYVLIAVVMLVAITAPHGIRVYEYLGQLGLGIAEASGQFIPHGRFVLLIAGLASTASALNATIFSSSRIAFALGREGDLPGLLARIHPVDHTPHVALACSCFVMVLMIATIRLREVAVSTDIMFLLLYFMFCTTVIVLRRKWPDRERPFRVPFFPIFPVIGIVAGLGLSIALIRISRTAWLTVGLWLLAGLILYYAWHPRQRERV